MSRAAVSLAIQVGDPIPSIGLRATDGYLLNLRSWVGKAPVAEVYFSGPSLTGAARQAGEAFAREMAAAVPRLDEAGIALAGITTDSEEQQKTFAESLGLPYLLLSDERLIAASALGVPTVEKRGNTNVTSPVLLGVDATGVVRGVYHDPDPRLLAAIILEIFREPAAA